eukprot:CAMPEP_0176308070 /NCGR_PEP_ID=MMETSP0121_2-20121125/64351_1 /TAXON_ID=160619 /ORGANISM="Kryptoperidinium foliaceum, Strain CCMP 1326" /LENGTH=52 /DNA_ID=CAMNT_0017649885 /DNA_START=13 /DNA_END=167 /DNA_ORIENTATION=-
MESMVRLMLGFCFGSAAVPVVAVVWSLWRRFTMGPPDGFCMVCYGASRASPA